jgi:predicted aminopeptidase
LISIEGYIKKGFVMKALKVFFLIFTLTSLTGCGNILYISKLGWHQSFISFHSVPVQEIPADKGVDEETKEKIRFIQEVKRFGEKRLGLRETKSYSTFFVVKGPILHVVSAAEKDHLQLYVWKFPIIGRVTYKGFFTREDVLKEKKLLEGMGYDTFVHGVGAYSTLGWLKDPIFSSFLDWGEEALANLILHEMAHGTIYFKGETDLNEQMATFIGNRGAIEFLAEKYGPESKEVVEAMRNQEDDLLFSEWIDQACQRLSTYYGREISRDEKLRGRGEIFQSIKEEFREIKDQLKTDSYKDFEKLDLNNAVLLAYRRYIHRLWKFEILYEQLGRDIRRVVEYFKTIQASGDQVVLRTFLE